MSDTCVEYMRKARDLMAGPVFFVIRAARALNDKATAINHLLLLLM